MPPITFQNILFQNKKNFLPLPPQFAGVVKLVDTPDLGSGAARHGGSSPSTRT